MEDIPRKSNTGSPPIHELSEVDHGQIKKLSSEAKEESADTSNLMQLETDDISRSSRNDFDHKSSCWTEDIERREPSTVQYSRDLGNGTHIPIQQIGNDMKGILSKKIQRVSKENLYVSELYLDGDNYYEYFNCDV